MIAEQVDDRPHQAVCSKRKKRQPAQLVIVESHAKEGAERKKAHASGIEPHVPVLTHKTEDSKLQRAGGYARGRSTQQDPGRLK
ncbi:hypothetical protein Adu01nite_90570 [Paractinoplanes durhamensis]|uniref:Uncharacterized protein n=1 Tax=Paractinoplanes durhamensis TaxID=113563 RepID=A0ABQ3ZD17_9ACTN|nr:hypothetical protein Adu01nite_90570 [Actinoplanes durhamensis]